MSEPTIVYKAPYPYFGGKSRIAPEVWQRFGEVRNYVEPFFGSGAMLLARPKPDGIETVNDLDGFVSNFWRALQADPDGVAFHADWPVNECIPAGTMIATPTGAIAIEHIEAGMLVWGVMDGRLTATRVCDTHRSSAGEFVSVGDLLLTSNHPVFTTGRGYIRADRLVDKDDFVMLQYNHEQTAMGHLHIGRPTNWRGALRRRHVPGTVALQRTYLSRCNGWANPSGLLDSVVDCGGDSASVSGDRVRYWGRLAGRRTTPDRRTQRVLSFGESYRRRRGSTGLYPHARTSAEVVCDAKGSALFSGATFRNAGQGTYTRSDREDSRRQSGAHYARQHEAEDFSTQKGQAASPRHISRFACRQAWQTIVRGSQTENRRVYNRQEACIVRRNWRNILVHQGCNATARCSTRLSLQLNTQALPLQRVSLPTGVAVYNFQTSTGNYFANNVLVHNCDLHARHIWLVNQKDSMQTRLEGDPEWFDVKVAGWWVWGMACWIGSGFCSGQGPWQVIDGKLVHLGNAGQGVNRQRVHLGDAGQGVNRQRVHLGDAGQGVNRKLVHLGDAGRGVNRKLPALNSLGGGAGVCAPGISDLQEYMRALAERLRRVRVCCGDWSRVCGPTPTFGHGLTAVFLDPPYSHEVRNKYLYRQEMACADAVRDWAVANGDNPLMRIALCGYQGEHELPGWSVLEWSASGGYEGQAEKKTNNRKKERVWFSPFCLKPDVQGGLFSVDAPS